MRGIQSQTKRIQAINEKQRIKEIQQNKISKDFYKRKRRRKVFTSDDEEDCLQQPTNTNSLKIGDEKNESSSEVFDHRFVLGPEFDDHGSKEVSYDISASSEHGRQRTIRTRPAFSRFDPEDEEHMEWASALRSSKFDTKTTKNGVLSESTDKSDANLFDNLLGLKPDFAIELRNKLATDKDVSTNEKFSFLESIGRGQDPAKREDRSQTVEDESVISNNKQIFIQVPKTRNNESIVYESSIPITEDMLYGRKSLPNIVLAESEDSELMNSLTSSFRQTNMEHVRTVEKAWNIRRGIFVKYYKSKVKLERKKNQKSEKTQ